MGTAEWIALGLLLISLIGWRQWRATYQKTKPERTSEYDR